MKKIAFLLILLICSCSDGLNYRIDGETAQPIKNGDVIYLTNGRTQDVIDSTIVDNSRFSFSGKTEELTPFVLKSGEISIQLIQEQNKVVVLLGEFSKIGMGKLNKKFARVQADMLNFDNEFYKISTNANLTAEDKKRMNEDLLSEVCEHFFPIMEENMDNLISVIIAERLLYPYATNIERFNELVDLAPLTKTHIVFKSYKENLLRTEDASSN